MDLVLQDSERNVPAIFSRNETGSNISSRMLLTDLSIDRRKRKDQRKSVWSSRINAKWRTSTF